MQKIHNKTLKATNIKRKITKILWCLVFVFVFFSVSSAAHAASLYFSPSSGSYTVGGNFSVNVYVSSSDQAMNAASGIISFTNDKLEVASLSKSGSVFNLWVQEPSFSNNTGTVNFEGIVLNPGFTGSAGKIITVNFKAMAVGDASVTFSSGSVLANDGNGTNILSSLGKAVLSVSEPTSVPSAPEPAAPPETTNVPLAPKILSPTHPDPNEWYADNNPKFEWSLPKDANGVNVLADKKPNTNPGTKSDGLFDFYAYENVDNGIWYFHIRLRNNAGWGGISHFQFQVDTEKPTSFDIKEVEREDLTEPKVKFIFDASDKISGIDYYEIKIDNGNSQIWQDDGNHTYETSILGTGKHILIAKAIDKAGNFLMNSAEFIIEALEPPIITEYPRELQSGEVLIIKGTAYPNAQVVIWLQKEKEEAKSSIIKSDREGKFIFVADEKPKDGIYKLWAEAIDERGARSKPTEKLTIVIKQPEILKTCSLAVNFLAVIIPLIALILLLIFLLWFGWHKFSLMRRKVKKEVQEAEQALHKAFDLLKEDIQEQIELLEKVKSKRELTEEEIKIIKQLKKDLDDAEKFVRKEIEDIEEEVG